MGRTSPSYLSHYTFFCLLALLPGLKTESPPLEEMQTFIIHMDHSQKPEKFSTHESWHQNILDSLAWVCLEDKQTLLYSYSYAMHGFSAKLTRCQLSHLEKSPTHVSTQKDSSTKLLTTHTPDFLGLKRNAGIWPAASYGEDVIIGVIDTGIWPESESFNDEGMSKVPTRWKGKCENGTAFSSKLCNRKLIGARSFKKGLLAAGRKILEALDFDSARDFMGHGSHTSSIAAGNYVLGASHFGYGRGTARGIAPSAHIAMYKAIWANEAQESLSIDVLAGMDQAIADGVDVMSLSLRLSTQKLYFEDVIAIAALSAIEKGIFVVCGAGNEGPVSHTTYNGAPWIMTVGAGTIDRSYIATLELGNGLIMEGTSYFPESVYVTNRPLYYGSGNRSKARCLALDPNEVAGKVVLCDKSNDLLEQIEVVSRVGAYAAIFLTESLILDPFYYSIPGLLLHTSHATAVKEYAMGNTSTVKSIRFMLTKIGTGPAPQVATFSSRGPDPVTPGVLKPDILAPGFDVLAAWRPDVPFMEVGKYVFVTEYALISGTSMATPHVAGVGALLKAMYPKWSPAAIRSAIMTTATNIDSTGGIIQDQSNGLPATPLEFGAGHISPNTAMDPGLIYDIGLQNYIDFLCGLGYNKKQMEAVTRRSKWSCGKNSTDLNYPSFIAKFSDKTISPLAKDFSRIVTNVGDPTSTYTAVIEAPVGMRITVQPSILMFTRKYQKQEFLLSIQVDKDAPRVNYGYLRWIDEHKHIVSSPIVVVID